MDASNLCDVPRQILPFTIPSYSIQIIIVDLEF